jgi:hypothetical protein
MQRIVMLSTCAAVMVWAASAVADSPQLKGSYGFTGSATCIVTNADGFNSNGAPIDANAPIDMESFAVEGVRTFNGDGTGTVTGSSIGVEIGPFTSTGAGSAASGDTFSFSFTYTTPGDGTWTSDVSADATGFVGISGTVTAGPRMNQTFQITEFPTVTGQISQNAMTLTAATIIPSGLTTPTPQMETVTYTEGEGVKKHKTVITRICHRSRILINLPNGK